MSPFLALGKRKPAMSDAIPTEASNAYGRKSLKPSNRLLVAKAQTGIQATDKPPSMNKPRGVKNLLWAEALAGQYSSFDDVGRSDDMAG